MAKKTEVSSQEIYDQSKAAYGQWCVQWREHAKFHSKFKMKSFEDFRAIGIGKAVLLIANGYSFEENLEVIKNNQDNVDIMCCDKTLGSCIEHGIVPTFCMVADANVDYEKYMKPYEDKLDKTIMFQNVCGNINWSKNGNWKDIYFYVNKDILQSELEFSELSGCKNFIPAGTNVSNAMVILLNQSDNKKVQNLFGYDKYLLIGFDYSWQKGKYYSFNHDGNGKDNYMRHIYLNNLRDEYCFSSNNLMFSARWLDQYIKTFRVPAVQCTGNSILPALMRSTLPEQIKYRYKPEDASLVRGIIKRADEITFELNQIRNKLNIVAKDHNTSFLATT